MIHDSCEQTRALCSSERVPLGAELSCCDVADYYLSRAANACMPAATSHISTPSPPVGTCPPPECCAVETRKGISALISAKGCMPHLLSAPQPTTARNIAQVKHLAALAQDDAVPASTGGCAVARSRHSMGK